METTTKTTPTNDRKCEHCKGSMAGKRPQAKHCGDTCSDRARRARERAARPADWQPKPKGRPGPRPRARKYLPGDTFGELTLVEYRSPSKAGSRALFRCTCGNEKEVRVGNVSQGLTTNCADRSKHPHPRARPSGQVYGTKHQQMTRDLGSAKELPCQFCAEVTDWNQRAYLYSDPDERADSHGREKGMPFSEDSSHYVVLCKKHHTRFDSARHRATPPGLSLAHVALQAALTADEVSQ